MCYALLLSLLLAGCSRCPQVQAFPVTCPAGYTFLYTEHKIEHGQLKEWPVCRKDG